jgi:WD40 repeat protein
MEVFMQRSWHLLDFAVQPFRENRSGLIVLVLAPFLCFLNASLSQASTIISQPGSEKGPQMDQYGDPLPKGALARLGTLRLRHPGYIGSMLFSPDGKTLATTGNGAVCLWDWASGKELPRLPAVHVGALAFSPDGQVLACASDREKIHLWDIKKTKELAALEVRRESSMVYRSALALADNGKVLVYAGDDWVAQGWEVTTRKERLFFHLPKKGDILSAVAIAPAGKVLAYAGRWVEGLKAGPVCLFDLTTGKELHCLGAHKQPVWSLAFSPDGAILASASETELPILWDVVTGKPLRTLQGEKHDSRFLAFSPDGRTLASGDSWNKLRLWDVTTGRQIEAFQTKLLGNSSLAFSQDGKTLAVADNNAVRLLEARSGKEIKPHLEPSSEIHSLGWLADGKTVALGTSDAVWLREVTTGKALGTLWKTPKPLFHGARFFAVAPDGKYFGLARGPSVELFDTASRKSVHKLVGSNVVINSVVFSADSKKVAAAIGYGVVRVWDCATGKSCHDLQGKSGTSCVAFSPDGKVIATGYASSTGATSGIQFWDQASGQLLRALPINKAWVNTLAYSRNSKSLAAFTDSQWANHGGLLFWDLPVGKQRVRVPKVDGFALAFSPDGKFLACQARDHAVCLLDAETGKERHCFEGHCARLTALMFSSDGKLLVSGSRDGTALVWNIADLKHPDG